METPRKLSPCPRCGAAVDCGMTNGDRECWCMKFPPVLSVPEDETQGCYCEKCLGEMIDGKSGAAPDVASDTTSGTAAENPEPE